MGGCHKKTFMGNFSSLLNEIPYIYMHYFKYCQLLPLIAPPEWGAPVANDVPAVCLFNDGMRVAAVYKVCHSSTHSAILNKFKVIVLCLLFQQKPIPFTLLQME
jgi:hypothetical protein